MTLERIIATAREERCLLRNRWDEGAGLSGREQLKLFRALTNVKPARIVKGGRRLPCEAAFELRPKDRRRLVEALLEEKVAEKQILAVVPNLTTRTLERIKANTELAKTPPANGLPERRITTKRKEAVGHPQRAYLDATSGADVAAARRFRELVKEAP